MGLFVGGIIVFLLFGIAATVAGIIRSKLGKGGDDRAGTTVVMVITALIALAAGGGMIIGSMLFQVPANHVAVEVLFGKPTATHTQGLQFKNPFSNIATIPGLQQESTYSAIVNEGEKAQADAVEAVTSDNAVVDVDVSILWNLNLAQAEEIYNEYRTLDQIRIRLLRPTSRDEIRDCVAKYPFEEARTSQRQSIASCARDAIAESTQNKGVIITSVQIRNMKAQSGEIQASINRKLEAEQAAKEAEFRRQQAEVDAETVKVKAQGEADAEITRAQGKAEANRLIAESLTPALLQRRNIEDLSSSDNVIFWGLDSSTTGSAPELFLNAGDIINGDLTSRAPQFPAATEDTDQQ